MALGTKIEWAVDQTVFLYASEKLSGNEIMSVAPFQQRNLHLRAMGS